LDQTELANLFFGRDWNCAISRPDMRRNARNPWRDQQGLTLGQMYSGRVHAGQRLLRLGRGL